jgi:hypothetical protein
MKRIAIVAATSSTALALAMVGVNGAAAGHTDKVGRAHTDRAGLADLALPLGLQVARKHATRPTVMFRGTRLNAPNPYLANLRNPARVDWSFWSRLAMRQAKQRAAVGKVPTPFVYDEQEAPDAFGGNDVQANAEQIAGFGIGAGKQQAVRIEGHLTTPQISASDLTTDEDQGSIPLATETGIPDETNGVSVESVIGDGPFGSGSATPSGDFDFFHLAATAGQVIRASTAGSDFDTILLVYDADGNVVAVNDDSNGTLQSDLAYRVTADGDYYVLVTGFLCLPDDPFDSSSGTGADSEGSYSLDLTVGPADVDYYAVHLGKGDVLGGSIRGGATNLQVWRPNGAERVGSEFADASFIYPPESPLPGADGGNASFAYVAESGGWYAVSTSNGDGDYRIGLEVYRPGSARTGAGTVQKVFLDFNGERVNTGMWGGFGVVTLSPLSAFLGRWALPNSALNEVEDGIIATVRQNIKTDLAARGINDNFDVKVLNSRDNPNAWGQPNVTRVIVGGTIAQSGVPTIGIAQSIDPGNYAHQETALVLLDILSDSDPGDDASLNFYITPASDKIGFISTAVGNVVSHEIGHMLGNFHVDQFNHVLNLMDQGGNFPLLYGVGPDGVGGTSDDPDVNFGIDTYNPNEGFTGLENTLNTSAWALSVGR